jgi:ferrous iron transport protein A
MVNPGEEVEMTGIRGGQGVQKRLSDLGLLPGTAMRVVQGGVDGPMIVAVRGDTRIALGRGVAQKVMVRMSGGQ